MDAPTQLRQNELFDAAKELVRHGFYLNAAYSGEKRPKGEDWQLKSTQDLNLIRSWCRKGHNIGVRLGPHSGVVVVEADSEEGNLAIQELQRQHGEWITPQTKSKRSHHYWFKWDDRLAVFGSVENVNKIECRLGGTHDDGSPKGCYLNAPPSIHTKEGYDPEVGGIIEEVRYRWVRPPAPDLPFARFPDELVQLLQEKQSTPGGMAGKVSKADMYNIGAETLIGAGSRYNSLRSLIFQMRMRLPGSIDQHLRMALAWQETYCQEQVYSEKQIRDQIVYTWRKHGRAETDTPFTDADFRALFDGMAGQVENDPNEIPRKPFPIDALPGDMPQFVRECASLFPADWYAFFLLGALGAAVMGRFELKADKRKWKAYGVLWQLLVADSGRGKSPVLELISSDLTTVLFEQEKETTELINKELEKISQYKKALAQHEKDPENYPAPLNKPQIADAIAAIKENPPVWFVTDATPEAMVTACASNKAGVIAIYDEANALFQTFNGSKALSGTANVSKWLELQSGASISLKRQDSKKNISAERAFLSICGGIQYPILERVATQDFIDSGFTGRMVMYEPPFRPFVRPTEESLTEIAKTDESLRALLRKMFQVGPSVFNLATGGQREVIELEPGLCRRMFLAFVNDMLDILECPETKLGPAETPVISKANSLLLRICLILHVAEIAHRIKNDDSFIEIPPVPASVMKNAIEITYWMIAETRRVSRKLGAHIATQKRSTVIPVEDPMVLFVKDAGEKGVKRHEFIRRFNLHRKGIIAETLCDHPLFASGRLQEKPLFEGGKEVVWIVCGGTF